MAQDNPNGFHFKRLLTGGMSPPMWRGLLLSNQKVATGDVLYASAGYLRNAITTDKMPVGVCQTRQLTSVTRNVSISFIPALDHVVFEAQCSGTPTQAKVWITCDVEGTPGNSNGISQQEINEDAYTNDTLLVVGHDPGTSSMGANARLEVIFAKSKFLAKTWLSSGAPGA